MFFEACEICTVTCENNLDAICRFFKNGNQKFNASAAPSKTNQTGIGPKTQTWQRILRSCFLSSFDEFCSAVSKEKLKMSQPIRGNGHLVYPIGPKKTW